MPRQSPVHHIPNQFLQMEAQLATAAKLYGTPLYVYDLATIVSCWDRLRSIIPRATTVYYSVKANPNLALISTLHQCGASFEVASEGELEGVLAAGVSAERVLFVGPGKTTAALRKAIEAGVGILVAESPGEVTRIRNITEATTRSSVDVALRINPGKSSGRVSMGGTTAFGMKPAEALDLLNTPHPGVHIVGFHGYLGTGLLKWQDIVQHAHTILQVARDLQQRSGRTFNFIDVGGGFGIPYFANDQALQIDLLQQHLDELFAAYLREYPGTTLAMESGRYVVGPAGVFIARIMEVKDVAGQCFAVLDGGTNVMGLAERYLGQRATPFRILESEQGEENVSLTMVGPLCTPTDRLAVEQQAPRPTPGKLVAFYQAGAYGLTAAPGLFLGHGFPAEVLIDGNKIKLIRKRLELQQLLTEQIEDTPWVNLS